MTNASRIEVWSKILTVLDQYEEGYTFTIIDIQKDTELSYNTVKNALELILLLQNIPYISKVNSAKPYYTVVKKQRGV